MKTNITLKVDRELLRRTKVIAAEMETSVSALVAEQLEKIVRERDGYEQAKRRALANLKKGFNLGFAAAASRDELHER